MRIFFRFIGKSIIYLALSMLVATSFAQNTLSHRVIVVSNTADIPLTSPVLDNLSHLISSSATPASVILVGDLTDGKMNMTQDSLRISGILNTVRGLDHVDLIIIPGDRDWANSGSEGWKQVRKLEKLVSSFNLPNVRWAIKKGCPGPKEILLAEGVLLIAMQTQWWNHPYEKPHPADADCKIASEDNFNEELEDIIEENENKNILLAGHFPIISYGNYGGKWSVDRYLFPIPVISGLWPAFRSNVGTPKDISNSKFEPLKDELEEVLEEQHGLIYLSGHEHNLQILNYKDHYLINSGSPGDPRHSGKGRLALYAESQAGLIELRYYDSGKTDAVVHGFDKNKVEELETFTLYHSTCESPEGQAPPNSRFVPCRPQPAAAQKMQTQANTTTTVQAGSEYQASDWKQSWLGKHYRNSWAKRVKVPYLNLDTTFQGLTAYQKGGGRQTTSLKFKAGDGSEYVFRSVNKDPTKALDYEFRETVVGEVVRDQTSAQQPYGAMAADILLNKLDLLHAHPRLFVLPKDDKLGPFKETYGGLLGMLEERPTNPKKVARPFAQADQVLKSYKMFRELYDDHDNSINSTEFARARVFDMLVGDWGKHEDNWKWAGFEKPGGVYYRPIPRDRDHVFSLWDGILPWLADREWAKPSAANFGYEITGIRSLMWQARHLDRYLGNELTRKDWVDAAVYIQNQLNEEDIDQAIRNMPMEIYEGDGKIIGEKLGQRLKKLDQAASEYYDMLAKYVDVVGSNKKECFEVLRAEDGSVEVTVCDLDKATQEPDSSRMYYHRKFLPGETKEIRLYGLQKADHFHIFGDAAKSIPIRVIGGPGADQIIDESKVGGWGKMTKVYEKHQEAVLDLGSEARQVKHWNDEVYNYDRTAFAYNTYFPLAFVLYNNDFGIGLRAGIQFTRQKFGKKDYASKHAVQVAASSENINVLTYEGRFHHVLGKWDVTLAGVLADHFYFTYFFGIGNDTEKDDDLFDDDYYRTNYNTYQLTAGLAHEFWEENKSHFAFQIHYENNAEQIEENTILTDPENTQDVLGTEDTNLWEAIFNLELDFRDRTYLPEKGLRAVLKHQSGIVTTENDENYGITRASFEGFVTAYLKRPVTLGIRVGGSKTYGEVPFYKLKYLGQNNDLRGYLRNRFTGESTIFLNTELRWELSEFRTAFFPIRFGLKAFYDTGRVYSDFDLTDDWHSGYGAGFYLIPLREEISLNISLAFSDEESGLLLIGIGKAF